MGLAWDRVGLGSRNACLHRLASLKINKNGCFLGFGLEGGGWGGLARGRGRVGIGAEAGEREKQVPLCFSLKAGKVRVHLLDADKGGRRIRPPQ